MNIETAKRLFEYRKANGYSQEELAEKIGVSRQAISKWERSESSPDTDNLIALANLYGVTIDELLNGAEPPKKTPEEQPADTTAEEAYDNNYNYYNNEKSESTEPEINFNNGFNVNDGKDKVHIGWDGIHVESKNGDNVHVSGSGVHVQNGGHIYYDSNQKPQKNPWLHALLPISTIILYLILGFTTQRGWAIGWILFLLIPVIESAVTSFKTRNPSHFAYPVLAVTLYLTGGMCFNVWHPTWIIFITIPMYYLICDAYKKTRKNKEDTYTSYNDGSGTYYSPDENSYPVNTRSKGGTIAAVIIAVICGLTIVSVVALTCVFSFLGKGMDWIGDFVPEIANSVVSYDDYGNENLYSIGSAQIPADGITEISVDWISSDINIKYYDGDTISIEEPQQKSESHSLRYRVDGNELKIKYCKSGLRDADWKGADKKLTLLLPADLQLINLDVDSVSSNLVVNGINANELNAETVSGNITADGNFTKIDINSVSGNFDISTAVSPVEVESESVSGNFTITMPSDISGFTLRTSTVSGSFKRNDFSPVTSVTDNKGKNGTFTYGNGSTEIDLNSVSGDFEVKSAA